MGIYCLLKYSEEIRKIINISNFHIRFLFPYAILIGKKYTSVVCIYRKKH